MVTQSRRGLARLRECRLEAGLGALRGLCGEEDCDQLVMSALGERGVRGETELMFLEPFILCQAPCEVLRW